MGQFFPPQQEPPVQFEKERVTISTGTIVMIAVVLLAAYGAYHTFMKPSAPPPVTKTEQLAKSIGLVIRERVNGAHPGEVPATSTSLVPSEDDDGFYAVPGETTYHRGWCLSLATLPGLVRITPVEAANKTAATDCQRDTTPYPLPNAMTEPQRVCDLCDHDPRHFAGVPLQTAHVYVDRRTGYFHVANCKYVGPAMDDGGTARLALEAGYRPDPECVGPALK